MDRKKEKLTLWEKIFLWIAVFMIVSGILGVHNKVGIILLLVCGIFFLAAAFAKRMTGRKHKMLTAAAILTALGLSVHAVVWNYFAYGRQPQPTGEATVVVLGCKIQGESPSLMLKRRLLRAQEYLMENPQANCVVSGGVGDGESYSEAHVMKKFLVENGIEESRIYEENRSRNTATNIQYSLQVIDEKNLSDNLIICSDGFHQLRAWMYVRKNHAQSTAISGRTPFWVVPSYALRELAGIVKLILIG